MLAITGHRGLSAEVAVEVGRLIRAAVPAGVVGVSCLADGPDAVFAQAVLDAGGELVVVLPADGYREVLPSGYWPTFDDLLARAVRVVRLPFEQPDSRAFMAASEWMVDEADELLAVWDGLPSRALGGTADVVAYARKRGVPVTVVWPAGATR